MYTKDGSPWTKLCTSDSTCKANSFVGTMINICIGFFNDDDDEEEEYNFFKAGNKNAYVLPVPVAACKIQEIPEQMGAIAAC